MSNEIQFTTSLTNWVIYKHPNTQFHQQTRLIATSNQVILVVQNNKLETSLENGTFRLNNNENNYYPIEVYFLNKNIKFDFFWGTTKPITVTDQKLNFDINIRSYGVLNLKLNDYFNFISNFVIPNINGNGMTIEGVNNYFRTLINQKLNEIIKKYFTENQLSFTEINNHTSKIKDLLIDSIKSKINNLGFLISNFNIDSINISEEEFKKYQNSEVNKNE